MEWWIWYKLLKCLAVMWPTVLHNTDIFPGIIANMIFFMKHWMVIKSIVYRTAVF